MFEIGTPVRIDENGWLVEAIGTEAIGVVCGEPNYATSTVSVSLNQYPNTIQMLGFQALSRPSIKESRSLEAIWSSYCQEVKKTRRKLKLRPA